MLLAVENLFDLFEQQGLVISGNEKATKLSQIINFVLFWPSSAKQQREVAEFKVL